LKIADFGVQIEKHPTKRIAGFGMQSTDKTMENVGARGPVPYGTGRGARP
jgi:hypothetical protein